MTRDTVGIAVVGDAVVNVAAGRTRAALISINKLLHQHRIRLAHVHLLVDYHTKFPNLLDVTVLPRIKGQALPPDGRVALGEPYNVTRHQELPGFVPDGDVHTGGAIGHFERSNFAVLFGYGRVANLQNDKHYVDVLLPRADVLYLHVFHRNLPRIAHRTKYIHTYTQHTLTHSHTLHTHARNRADRK